MTAERPPESHEVELQPYLDVVDRFVREASAELDVPLGIIDPERAETDNALKGVL